MVHSASIIEVVDVAAAGVLSFSELTPDPRRSEIPADLVVVNLVVVASCVVIAATVVATSLLIAVVTPVVVVTGVAASVP